VKGQAALYYGKTRVRRNGSPLVEMEHRTAKRHGYVGEGIDWGIRAYKVGRQAGRVTNKAQAGLYRAMMATTSVAKTMSQDAGLETEFPPLLAPTANSCPHCAFATLAARE
jgi:hypothetical protein